MAKREIKGFAGMLKLRGKSPVWIGGLNIAERDKVRIVSSNGNIWEGNLGRPIFRPGGAPKARTIVEYKGDGSSADEFTIKPLVDEDIADLTVTVGPTVGFPGPEAGEIIVTNVVIDGP
jgi:hypothetical protein